MIPGHFIMNKCVLHQYWKGMHFCHLDSSASSSVMPWHFTFYYVAQNMTSAQLETLELWMDQNATFNEIRINAVNSYSRAYQLKDVTMGKK